MCKKYNWNDLHESVIENIFILFMHVLITSNFKVIVKRNVHLLNVSARKIE